MNRYYSLNWKDEKGTSTSAFLPEGTKLAQDLISELEGVNKLPFELHLIKLEIGKDGLIKSDDLTGIKEVWQDYQLNSLAWPLMSERMKLIVERSLTGTEGVDWIEVVVNGLSDQRIYYFLRFNKILDVLDIEKTKLIPGTDYILKPVFSISKIFDYSAFVVSSTNDNYWKIPSTFYVSEALKKNIQKERLTGISFETVTVA